MYVTDVELRRIISNFVNYETPLVYEDLILDCNEEWFQSQKSEVYEWQRWVVYGDKVHLPREFRQQLRITDRVKPLLLEKSARASKARGRLIPIREGWDEVRIPVMREGLEYKFQEGTHFLEKVLSRPDAYLCETNTWHDNFWGDCTCPKCRHISGENWLGKLVMALRDRHLAARRRTHMS